MHPKGDLVRINQSNFWPVLIKDYVDYWILFLTDPIRLSIFYHGRFAFFVWKTVFSANKVIKNTFIHWILHFTARFSLKYCKIWWKSRIGTFGENTRLHSNSKFRVFATEAFRSEKSTETSDYSTEVSGETNEKFESITTPKFRFW
jgi:hypothetical protein